MKDQYRSQETIAKKLSDAKYLRKKFDYYRGKLIVNNGLDKDTNAYPFLVLFRSFLSATRSVLLYARKEAKDKRMLASYNKRFSEHGILGFFRDLRNFDIHEFAIGTFSTLYIESTIQQSHMVKDIKDEPLTHEESESHMTQTITKRNDKESARRGKEIYQDQVFDNESDIFILSDKYLTAIEIFISEGRHDGFIS